MLELRLVLGMQTEKAVPGAIHTLVVAYVYLAYAQRGLHRVEEAESSLQKGLDATKSPLLQKALDAAQSSARLQSSVERQGATPSSVIKPCRAFCCVVTKLLLSPWLLTLLASAGA